MSGYLYPNGFFVSEQLLRVKMGKNYADLLAKLTLKYVPAVGLPIITRLYEKTKIGGIACIRLPRGTIPLMRKLFPISINLCPIQKVEFRKPDLYENQELLCNHLATNFTPERIRAGTATCVLDFQAGMGKTFVAGGMIYRNQMRTMYITLRKPLVSQAVDDLCKMFGTGVAVAWSKKLHSIPSCQPKIAVVVINSALKMSAQILRQYSFAIFDEIHTFCSSGRRNIFHQLVAPCEMGMTATIGERIDGLDTVYYKELTYGKGNTGITVAEDIPGFDYGDIVFTGTVDAIRYRGPSDYTKTLRHDSTGRMFCPYMNAMFLSDPYRMKLAVNEILKLYNWRGDSIPPQQHVIFVLCEERDPLPTLQTELTRLLGIDVDVPELKDIGVFRGGIKDEQIARMPTSRVILTTYGYASTGISINAATAMVLLTSRKAGKQLVGRILRRGGDLTVHRRIIDIIDDKTPIRRHHEIRKNAYDHYKLPVVESVVSWQEIGQDRIADISSTDEEFDENSLDFSE